MGKARAAVRCYLSASLSVPVTHASYSTAPDAKDNHLSFLFFKKPFPVHDLQKQKGISFHHFQHYKKSLRAHLHNYTFHQVNHTVHHGLALVPCQKMNRFAGNEI